MAACYALDKSMPRPVRLTNGRPSAAGVAEMFGISKKRAKNLSFLAEHALKTGEYVLPGVGRLVKVTVNGKKTYKIVKIGRMRTGPKSAIARNKK